MRMPLKDFYALLRIKSEEEKQKQEYMRQQQMRSTNQLKSQDTKIKY